jgi:ubiquinone/menaquinone biosynthesis C-methylase UbiE
MASSGRETRCYGEEDMDSGRGTIGEAYVLPRHPSEVDRLDVQHFALRTAMRGNYLAPIGRPARILDVGCGTGQWAYELCAEFPEAMVVGLDLAPSKPNRPANYEFVRANVLQGLPFPDAEFDFVHQRLLISGVPLKHWSAEVAELVRVTRPAGWLELVEAMPHLVPEGPATKRLWDLLRQLGRTVGHDTLGHVGGSLGRYLSNAGAQGVQTRSVALPIGEWGDRVGPWMACDIRSLFTRLAGVFEPRFAGAEAEYRELMEAMFEEFERLKSTITTVVAFGRRPGPSLFPFA